MNVFFFLEQWLAEEAKVESGLKFLIASISASFDFIASRGRKSESKVLFIPIDWKGLLIPNELVNKENHFIKQEQKKVFFCLTFDNENRFLIVSPLVYT